MKGEISRVPSRGVVGRGLLRCRILHGARSHDGFRRGRALITRFRNPYPSAMECPEKYVDECLTYLLVPGRTSEADPDD